MRTMFWPKHFSILLLVASRDPIRIEPFMTYFITWVAHACWPGSVSCSFTSSDGMYKYSLVLLKFTRKTSFNKFLVSESSSRTFATCMINLISCKNSVWPGLEVPPKKKTLGTTSFLYSGVIALMLRYFLITNITIINYRALSLILFKQPSNMVVLKSKLVMKLGSFLSTWMNLTSLHLFWYLMFSIRLKKLFWSDGLLRYS